MSWEQLCRPGDDEVQVRDALLAEFDLRWTGGLCQSLRTQLLSQGFDLATALAAAEQARRFLRAEQADQAPTVMARMAASAARRH